MTTLHSFKQAVRTRMAETGESYTEARQALILGAISAFRSRAQQIGQDQEPSFWRDSARSAALAFAEECTQRLEYPTAERVREFMAALHPEWDTATMANALFAMDKEA